MITNCKYPSYKLGDCAISEKIVDGPFGSQLKVEDYRNEGIPVIRVGNCSEGEIDDDLVFITEEKHRELNRSEVLPGDVILTKAGSLGYSVVFPEKFPKGNITSHLASIRPAKDMDPYYLSCYLKSRLGTAQLYRWGNKTTRPELNTEEVREIRIIKPSNKEQRSLAEYLEHARKIYKLKLEEADNCVFEINQYINDILGIDQKDDKIRMFKAVLYKDLIGRRLDAPAYLYEYSYKSSKPIIKKPLGDICDINSHEKKITYKNDDIVPYIGLPDCSLTTVKSVSLRPYKEVSGRSIVKKGDILYARIEPSVFNKKYIYVDDLKGHPFAFTSTEFYVLTPKQGENAEFIYAMLFSDLIYRQAIGKTIGSTGRRRVPIRTMKEIMVPYPDKDIQSVIANEFFSRHAEASKLRYEADKDWQAACAEFEKKLLS